jgi:putative FmdB family regulatory protein
MPTYDYVCVRGHLVSEKRGIGEDSKLERCPSCTAPLRRQFTAPPISFKGEGFVSERG